MVTTPEARVKKVVKNTLDLLNIYHFSPAANGFGRAGIPDIIACSNGRFIAFECKAGKNTTTALQERELNKIRLAKGLAFVINEDNMHNIEELLTWSRQDTH
jgi:hypothetical protein